MSKNNIANPVFQGSAIFERGIKISGLTKKHVGLLNVDNTTDALKPISNPTKLYVDTKISDLIGGAPDALNTLKEIATAIGSNPVPADLGAIKANVKDPTFTGSARFNNYIDPTNGQVTSGDVKFAVPATFTTAPKAFTLGLNNLVVPSVPVNLEDLTTKQYVDTKASETVASGNAATATKLANARLIGGVSFDGSANIDLPGVNSIGNQSTTGNAATVTTNANLTGVVTSIGNTTSIADDGLSIAKTNGLQEALNDKAPINNPTFTGTVSGLFSVEETEYFTPPSVASAGTMIFDYISNNLYICVKSWFESSTGEAVWKIVATTSI